MVDDGSTDQTRSLVKERQTAWPALRLVLNGENRGKGYSVRHGMLEARGKIALFTDADLSAPIEEAEKLLVALETFDAAIGSRAIDRRVIEVHQSPLRETCRHPLQSSRANHPPNTLRGHAVRFQGVPAGGVANRFPATKIEGFGFDPEILVSLPEAWFAGGGSAGPVGPRSRHQGARLPGQSAYVRRPRCNPVALDTRSLSEGTDRSRRTAVTRGARLPRQRNCVPAARWPMMWAVCRIRQFLQNAVDRARRDDFPDETLGCDPRL